MTSDADVAGDPPPTPAARRFALTPLRTGSRSDAVTARLREAIFLGFPPDGHALPSESELANELAVSTKTIREALAALRDEGLIETRRGRSGGSFVHSRGGSTKKLTRRRFETLSISEIRDAADEHRAVAGMAALLAADRADDDQLAAIHSHLTDLTDATTDVARGRADTNFHIDIAIASQSERLTRSEASLQRECRDLFWMLEPRPIAEVAREHGAIFAAIGDQAGNRARAVAEQHVVNSYRRLHELRLAIRQV